MQYLLAFLALLSCSNAVSQYCSTMCTYVQNQGTYSQGCSTINSNFCTSCDDRFFYLSGSTCTLLQGIYNLTQPVNDNDWTPSSGNGYLRTVDGVTWHQTASNVIFYTTQTLPEGIYGLRLRMGVIFAAKQDNLKHYIIAGEQLSEEIPIIRTTDSTYNLQNWIHTTQHFPYQKNSINIAYKRNQSTMTYISTTFGFRQLVILISKCVDGCVQCTSLSDCMQCSPGKYLQDGKICVTLCPNSTYPAIDTIASCKPCNPNCQQCSVLPTNCQACTDSGPQQAFLHLSSCIQNCILGYQPDHENHVCYCPQGHYEAGSSCLSCNSNCNACFGASDTECSSCAAGFFLQDGTTTCVSQCPIGQYQTTVNDSFICLLCDSSCYECDIDASNCTSCNSPSALPGLMKYLSPTGQCVAFCPDGYSNDILTYVCQKCPLGTYSYENDCNSYCPEPYTKSDQLRACILPQGYPLQLHVALQNKTIFKFELNFELGLSPESITHLTDANRMNFVTLTLTKRDSTKLVLQSTRPLLGTNSQSIPIDDMQLKGNKLVLLVSNIKVTDFLYAESFSISFNDNLQSPKNVIYGLQAQSLQHSFHVSVSSFLQTNISLLFMVGSILTFIPLVFLLFKIRSTYRILIEYIHCLQIVGLMLFSVYPHSASLYLYSFLVGLDYSNFSFVYNAPRLMLPPCLTCSSLASYVFVQGDMNWLRLMGSMLQALALLLVACFILWCFACSRKYSRFFLILICDLVIVKAVHSWMASLVFLGMNYTLQSQNINFFNCSMHFAGSIVILIIVYRFIRRQWVNNYINVSFICLLLLVCVQSVISVSPLLLSSTIVSITLIEWIVIYVLELDDNELPKNQQFIDPLYKSQQMRVKSLSRPFRRHQTIDHNFMQTQLNVTQMGTKKESLLFKFHNHLLRSLKPITAMIVSSIAMIEPKNGMNLTISISVILAVLLLLIMIDSCLIHLANRKQDDLQLKEIGMKACKIDATIDDMISDVQFNGRKEFENDSLKDRRLTIDKISEQIREETLQAKFKKRKVRKPITLDDDEQIRN